MEDDIFIKPKPSLPSRESVKKLTDKAVSFEDFKSLLERELGPTFVQLYALDLWKREGR